MCGVLTREAVAKRVYRGVHLHVHDQPADGWMGEGIIVMAIIIGMAIMAVIVIIFVNTHDDNSDDYSDDYIIDNVLVSFRIGVRFRLEA